jgi:hypothetical protein
MANIAHQHHLFGIPTITLLAGNTFDTLKCVNIDEGCRHFKAKRVVAFATLHAKKQSAFLFPPKTATRGAEVVGHLRCVDKKDISRRLNHRLDCHYCRRAVNFGVVRRR